MRNSLFSVLVGFVGLFVAFNFTGCAATNQSLSNKEIAVRVEAVLRNAPYLEDSTVVAQRLIREDAVLPGGAGPYFIEYRAAPGFFNSQLSSSTEVRNRFASFDGVYQEIRPTSKMALLEYPAPFAHGTDNLRGSGPQDCLMGSHIYSWLGADGVPVGTLKPDRAASMRKKIEQGKRLPDTVEQSHKCYVFCETLEASNVEGPDRFIYETVYVDKYSFLVVRWDTENLINGYIRSRIMNTRIFDKVPEGIEWRMTLD